MTGSGPPAETVPGAPGPVRLRDRARVGRPVVAEDELAHPGSFGHAADLADVGVQRGHPGQFGLVRAVHPPRVHDHARQVTDVVRVQPSTLTADEIPPRPATGIGAPAVPSSTNSVVMSHLANQRPTSQPS